MKQDHVTAAKAPDITPDMIDAGVMALLSFSIEELTESEESQAEAVAHIFEAMASVSRSSVSRR